ncbi:MAG: 4-(cytidine 5'-diphospho)-2-C-methyl-D-erythritol kinase [Burkholderiales bacterium]|jgi:4-diphosphocytidyl-2-C-methyl-D-erythritol kinase|nr:4-(cytidine 5'-diphospho)-2-C-methyl-D-erythritol kinase [Burkholderiales bacterium]
MQPTQTYLSPAKINWFLHIVGKRADGYHLLETVFQKIDWCDELHISPNTTGQIQLTGDLSGVAAEHNLIHRAASALKVHAHTQSKSVDDLGADIHIHKNIPTGAGLGGGSSNAATVLIALNQLWQLDFDNDTLQAIGLQLGADVPFFVSPQPSAFAQGIGEKLTPIELPARELLLVKPNVHADTRAVYQHPQLVRDHAPLNMIMSELSVQLRNLNAHTLLSNDMQAAAFAIAPEIKQVRDALQNIAPQAYVRMSGSGATVFVSPQSVAERDALNQWLETCPADWQHRWCRTLSDAPFE